MIATTTKSILDLTQIIPIAIQLFITIITVSLAYWFGMKAYVKQRRREEIRETYITGGIEKVMSDLDEIMIACYYNHSKIRLILDMLKNSLDTPKLREKTIKKIFSEMKIVHTAPNYSTQKMIMFGADFLPLLIVETSVELLQLNESMRYVMFEGIQDYFKHCEEKNTEERQEVLSEQQTILQTEWRKIMQKHMPFYSSLLTLQVAVDKQKPQSIKDLDKLATDKDIQKVITNIKELCSEQVERINETLEKNKKLIEEEIEK